MRAAAIITGTGLITPLGEDVESNWQALLAGRSIRDHARIPGLPESPSRIFPIAKRAALSAGGGNPGLHADALVVGTSKGEIDAWITSHSIPLPGIGNLASSLGDELGIPGPRLTISAACASGLQAMIRGVLLIAA